MPNIFKTGYKLLPNILDLPSHLIKKVSLAAKLFSKISIDSIINAGEKGYSDGFPWMETAQLFSLTIRGLTFLTRFIYYVEPLGNPHMV